MSAPQASGCLIRMMRQCKIEGCGEPYYARGWCNIHYYRWWRHGDPGMLLHGRERPACSMNGCDRPASARDLCRMHYARWRRHGSPSIVKSSANPVTPLADRLWAKVNKAGFVSTRRPDLGPCWLWTGALDGQRRYGKIKLDGKYLVAHRAAYEISVGPIPEGMEIDHLCGVTACVNPAHLEPVTRLENERRKSAPHRGEKIAS